MASNGNKRQETASIKATEGAYDTYTTMEVEKKTESLNIEADGSPQAVKSEVKEEDGHSKAKSSFDGIKQEEKITKQMMVDVEMAIMDSSSVKQTVRGISRDVNKNGENKQPEQKENHFHIRRKSISCDTGLWDSIEWNIAAGREVDAGQRLGTAGRLEEGTQRPIQAPCNGRLYLLTKEHSDELLSNNKEAGRAGMRTVAFVEYCIHPVRNSRTCLMCLAVVDDNEENEDMESVNVVSHGQVIRLNVEEARKFDSDNIQRQLGAKKLSLVLDLDHTLLHAVGVDDVVGEILKSGLAADETHYFFIPGLAQQHVVKLRPGLTEFLTNLSALYDLFIYTHGTRLYAEIIVKIIDPDEKYFKNRIVARTDTPDMFHKSLKLLFPSCDDSMILILDDRIDVWKENEGNVFLIEPYHYFKCTSEINNASGSGIAGSKDPEAEDREDKYLVQATSILEKVHEVFYAGHDRGMQGTTAEEQMAGNGRDVKVILSAVGFNASVHVFFDKSDDIPQSYRSHYLWRLVVDLGALPSMTLNDFPLTHLVIHPERLGTQKYVQAKRIPGAFVVTPDWILKCARSWSRVPEQDFFADEWKIKHRTKEPANLADRTSVSSEAGAASESVASSDVNGNDDGEQPPLSTCTISGAEEKEVISDLLMREESGAKRSKQISFAKVPDETDAPYGEDGDVQNSTVVKRSHVARRPYNNAGIVTGVVATGGTFDFLSKINATKREPNRVTMKKVGEEKNTPTRPACPPKDMDDAFLRLIQAEEQEYEKKEKRKHLSANIKDQLVSRRTNKDKRSLEFKATITKPDEKRMRAMLPELAYGEPRNDSGEEEELDDLEADILGDL